VPDPLRFPGETWSDVCAHEGQWYHSSCAGTRVLVRTKAFIVWSASIGVETIGVRLAIDHLGRSVVVGKRQDTGYVVAAVDGQRIDHEALNVNVHGPTGVCVTYDFLRHEWLIWRMHDGFTRAVLRIDPNPLRLGEWTYEDIRHLMPEGTADGFSYVLPGPDGYAIPQFTLLTRAQIPGMLNPSPAAGIWVGQHLSDSPRLIAFQDGVGRATLVRGEAFEPHAVEYASSRVVACAWDRPARTAFVVEVEVPITPDPKVEYPVVAPSQPYYVGGWHHEVDHVVHPDWGHLTVNSTMDVVTDAVPLKRPSIINPIHIEHYDPALIEGLLIHEPETPAGADILAREVQSLWKTAHPTLPIPPVCCVLSQRDRDQNWKAIPASLIACWIPELYFPEMFPENPEDILLNELGLWAVALGWRLDDQSLFQDRAWLVTLQLYDRNGLHAWAIDEVRRMVTFAHFQLLQMINVQGWLAFDVNRSGLSRYPNLLSAYESVAAVCSSPEHIAPFTPVEEPPKPPLFTLVVHGDTTVAIDQWVNFEVQLQAESGPITIVEWFHDVIGDGQPPRFADRTPGLTNKFSWDTPGRFQVSATGIGPGGVHQDYAPIITVQQEEEDMRFPSDSQYLDFLTQLHYQGYIGFLGRPEGLFGTSGHPSELFNPHDPDERVDSVGLSVWPGRYATFFATLPSNTKPDVHNSAMRHALKQIYDSEEAQNNPNRPPWPPEWNESFEDPQ
jgi:hypothetical protein